MMMMIIKDFSFFFLAAAADVAVIFVYINDDDDKKIYISRLISKRSKVLIMILYVEINKFFSVSTFLLLIQISV